MTAYGLNRRRFLAASAALGAYGLGGPLGTAARAQEGRVLNARARADIAILDPGYMLGPESETLNAVMPRLVDFGFENGRLIWKPTNYVSQIAEADPTHIGFTLKPGFQWTNGFGELTAEDVKYSYERMKISDNKGAWDVLDRVDIKDKYSGTLVLKHPFKPFWSITLTDDTATLVSMKATESVGGKYTTEIPATCGPYLFQWERGRRVSFTPNPTWAGPRPYFDRINYLLIKESKAADLAFEAGETDISKITGSTLARLRESPLPNSKIHVAGAMRYAWLGMNTEHPKLKDIRVRKAIQHAVDVDAVNGGAYPGAQRAYGIVPAGLVGKRNVTKINYDPEKSRALLAEAGVSGLQLELRTRNEHARVLAAQIVQANLAAVGITVKVIPMDRGQFSNLGQESKGDDYKDSQLWIQRFRADPDPFNAAQWFRRDQIGVWNWERWSSDEFEQLYERGLAEADLDERDRIYVRMQEIMEETGAYVWLAHEEDAFVLRDWVEPYLSVAGKMRFKHFERT